MPDLENIALAAGLVIRPGDVLVIGLSTDYVTAEQAERMRQQILRSLPLLADVKLITQCTTLAAYRQEPIDA